MRRSTRIEDRILLTLPLIHHRRSLRQIRSRRWLIILLALIGAGLLAAGLWLPAKAAIAQQLLNRAWSETQAHTEVRARPWPWADTYPVARLTLPDEPTPLTVLAGVSGRTLAFAPGLLDGSAPPGVAGVTVIAGHRDTHFRALERFVIGDLVGLERPDGRHYWYEVTALEILDTRVQSLQLASDDSVVALVTCWPFDAIAPGGPLRYVVTTRLVRQF